MNDGKRLEYRALGRTGLQVSALGFGALEIGRDWAADVNADAGHLSESEAGVLLNRIIDLGINLLDTAPAYWHSEEYIGAALHQRRSEFVLATKVGEHCDRNGSYYDYSADGARRFIDQSLQRLRCETIDLIQIHSASHDVLNQGETLNALQDAQAAGKVRFIGMSGGVSECCRAVEIGAFDVVQVPFNLLNPHAAESLFPMARAKNIGVLVMRPLAGGKLTEKFLNLENAALRDAIAGLRAVAAEIFPDAADPLAQAAIAFVLAHPEVSSILVGTRRLSAIENNIKLAENRFSVEALDRLRSASQQLAATAW